MEKLARSAWMLSTLIGFAVSGVVLSIASQFHLPLISIFMIGITVGIVAMIFSLWYFSSQHE